MKTENIVKNIPDWMIIDAFRYAMGRRTYQVSTTCEWLRINWKYLNHHTKAIVKRDLEGEIERFRVTPEFKTLGDDCDVAEWKYLLKVIHNYEKP